VNRIPVGARLSLPRAGLDWYQVSLSKVKLPARGVEYPPPPTAEVKERVALYLYSLSGPSWSVLR
jgi:hypothetical protein